MTKLSQLQKDLLASAATYDNGAIDPPEDAKLTASLIKRGLLISIPITAGGSRLLITEAGRAAVDACAPIQTPDQPGLVDLCATPEQDILADPSIAPAPAEASSADADAPKGKLGVLVALLSRREGATLKAMMAATGWQAHSVRGALSGALKKKRGLAVESEKSSHGRLYRIANTAA
jgi:hypothetical protein